MGNANKHTIIIILLIISFLLIFNYHNSQTEKTTIKTSFLVGNKSGFDLNPNELTFGQITPNNSISRDITITNNFGKTKKVNIKISGEIKDYIIVSENNFLLAPYEIRNITFSVYSTRLEEPKKYSGEVTIITK